MGRSVRGQGAVVGLRRSAVVVIAVGASLLALPAVSSASHGASPGPSRPAPSLVKDFAVLGSIDGVPFVAVGSNVFFVADDGATGTELWKSNGTGAGTVLVKDIWAGANSSSPANLTNVNGTLFFTANDGTNGIELWKSDGTAAGTVLVKDVRTGGDSSPANLTNVNGTLLFAADDGTNGTELWKSNGTGTGTVLVKDIRPGTGNSSSPASLTNVNGTLFFSANDGATGTELWKSDGTGTGTVLVKDIRENTGSSSPANLTNVNGTLFFSANDGATGTELWKSDGTLTTTVRVKDIWAGNAVSHSNPRDLTAFGAHVYFVADDGSNAVTSVGNQELWRSDGTTAGTVLVKDIDPAGSGFSKILTSPPALTVAGGMLFFVATDGTHGPELWVHDPASVSEGGTRMVKDISPAPNSAPRELATDGTTLFFSADDGSHGRELWRSDGTERGTVGYDSGALNPAYLTAAGGKLLFKSVDSLWALPALPSTGTFHPLSSARILNTAIGQTQTIEVQVTGQGGVPASGVSGVSLSVTVANASAASFLTVWPTGSSTPTASSLNWVPGETVANAVKVKVGNGGKVSLYNQWGTANVSVDVVGWYGDDTDTSGGRYNPLVPARILDTRDGNGAPVGALAPNGSVSVQVTGRGGVPTSGVSAVIVNLTVTPAGAAAAGVGALQAWPSGGVVPVGTNVPYDLSRETRRTVPTLVVTKVGADGKVNVANRPGTPAVPMHAVADVVGWYSSESASAAGARLETLAPRRILDTRVPCGSGRACPTSPDGTVAVVNDSGAAPAPLGPQQTVEVQVSGRGGVPDWASAVVVNVTVTDFIPVPLTPQGSFLTVWPTGSSVPTASNLNYVPGQTLANLVVVKLGQGGKVSFYNQFGTVQVIADVVGWYDAARL